MRAALRSFGLPSLLLVIVAITHTSYDLIGSFYENPVRAAATWHHVLRAFPEATLLYLIVWSLIPWKPISVRIAGSLICAWGALESFQIAACRVVYPMDQPPPKTELYAGLCDAVSGWPIYMLTIAVVLLVSLLTRPSYRDR
jgi:hypothetical protein